MFITLLEKELRETLTSPTFTISFAVCAVLIILSFFTGAANFRMDRAQNEAAKAETLRQLDGLTDWFGVGDHNIFLPPQPLAALVTGVSNDIGRTVTVKGRGELTSDNSRYGEDPMFAIFRFLDLEFIFGVILSLFAVLMGYDAISGEKERGTLRLSFANAVPRAVYILAKLVGRFLAVAVPILLAVAIGLLVLLIMNTPLSGGDWTRLGVVILTGLLYVGVFLTLSVFISALTQRSSTSFLYMLVIWIASVLIVPRASVLVAGRFVNVPQVDELSTKKASFAQQLWMSDRDVISNYQTTPGTAPDKMMEQFNKFMDSLSDVRYQKQAEFAGRLNEERQNRQLEQKRLAFAIARVSPTACFSLASMSLAGTDLDLRESYLSQATAYQTKFGAFLKEKTGVNPGGRTIRMRTVTDGEEQEKPKPIDPTELPAFTYNPVTAAGAINSALPNVGLLIFYVLLGFVGAVLSFLRYDVR